MDRGAKRTMIVGQSDREELLSQFTLTLYWPGDRVMVTYLKAPGTVVALRQFVEEGEQHEGQPNYLIAVKLDFDGQIVQTDDLAVEYILQ